MLEFFIALFGSIFYGSKYVKDKNATKEATARRDVSDAYYTKVNNIALENKLHYIFCHDRYVALDEISDNLTNIFGAEWKTVYKTNPFFEKLIGSAYRDTLGFKDVWSVAYDIYLAKHGLAPARHYNTSTKIRGIDEPDYSTETSKKIGIATCREIEHNIQQSHGVFGFRLYQDPVKPHLLTWEYIIDSYAGSKAVRMW